MSSTGSQNTNTAFRDPITSTPAQHDLLAVLSDACKMAAIDFSAAADWLRPLLANHTSANVLKCIERQLAVPEPGAIYCTIYLLAQAHSPELAASAGWYALEHGCDDDVVIIALSDVVQSQIEPRQNASEMMLKYLTKSRSTAFIKKLADHYRTEGHATLAEHLLHDMIREGRQDLRMRLAEHWIEFNDWRSARDLLLRLPPEQTSADALYFLGRCCASLLLEDEVFQVVETLTAHPEPGPRYAALLVSIWTWRVGDPCAAAASCPEVAFPPLIAQDANCLRLAQLPAAATGPSQPNANARRQPNGGVWRNIGSRSDLPNVLGIGMQRTGTTWLWKQLSRHPDVQTLPFKELAFFNDPFRVLENYPIELRDLHLSNEGRLYWQGPTRSLQHYRNLFGDYKSYRVDITPAYGELPEESVARVRDIVGSDTKILLSVRDPIERSWSNLKYNLKWTGEHPLSLTFVERISIYRSVASLRRSNYASVLRTWRRFFPNVMVIYLDDIETRPLEVLAEVRHFIGMSAWSEDDFQISVNTTDIVDMPIEDRIFLFGLHQPTYDASELELGGSALSWRHRQLGLINSWKVDQPVAPVGR